MLPQSISRRSFFARLFGAGIPAAVRPVASTVAPPAQAWVIVELGWEYNDEFSYCEGEFPRNHLFYDQREAEAECRRLCDAFFAAQTPEEFEVNVYEYLDAPYDEETVTWDELRRVGFPDPYYVHPLHAVSECKTS